MKRSLAALALAVTVALAAACRSGAPEPAVLDTRNEQCASCRMAVSDARLAAQIVAPGELPRFFDDVGCLGGFVKAGNAAAGATAFVADHRTKAWVRADRALFTRVPGIETPMGSHLIAHADADSRDADPDAAGGVSVPLSEIFGPDGPPAGTVR